MEWLLTRAFLLLLLVLVPFIVNMDTVIGAEKKTIECVVEWEQVAAADSQMPSLTMAQLRAEFEKGAAVGAGLTSWEARCRVTSQIDRAQEQDGMVASVKSPVRITTTHSTLLLSNGKQWLSERRFGDWQDDKTEYRNLGDGEHVQAVSPSQKTVIVQPRSEFTARKAASTSRPELPVGFPPFLETYREHYYPIPESLPDVRTILADPDAKVLPWRTRVNGHTCYVVERTTITESPVFRSREDAKAWTEQNPDRRVIQTVNASAKPDDKRIDKEIVRLALDPEAGFMPARWATGRGFTFPDVDYIQFPVEEITCTDFRKFGGEGYIAGRFQYTHYSTDRQGNQKMLAQQEVVLESFQVNRQYPSDFFHFDPPKGYQVLDSTRGISYSVGDSEEKIAALLTAAKTKKTFYEELKKKPVPPLEGDLWLNSEPIRLEDARGKHIRLHFWSMGCGPCVHELPQIQQEWERESRHHADPTVFISIHPYVNGNELQQLKDLLRKQHITFPVMVDSREPDGKAWGKTSAYYHVYSEPSEVWIDDKGNLARLDSERGWVNENDWWMSDLTKNASKSKNDGDAKTPVEKNKE